MKQRVVTGIFIAIFLLGYLFSMFTFVFPLLNALLAALSAYEIQKISGVKNKPLMGLSIASAALIPVLFGRQRYVFAPVVSRALDYIARHLPAFAVLLVLLSLILMLAKYSVTRFEHMAVSLFGGVAVASSYGCTVLLTNPGKFSEGLPVQVFFLMFSFSCAWVTDVFALFTGRAFGKHKLSPNISPKKTVEGAIGGIICAAVVNVIVLVIFKAIYPQKVIAPYTLTVLMSVVLSAAGMCGDLSASVIKRNYGAKDFSNLLPGHGGIMDRFDSCLFIWPCMFGILNLIPAI